MWIFNTEGMKYRPATIPDNDWQNAQQVYCFPNDVVYITGILLLNQIIYYYYLNQPLPVPSFIIMFNTITDHSHVEQTTSFLYLA